MRARTRHTRSAVVDSDESQSESEGSEARENGFVDDEALESAESTEEVSGSDEDEVDPFPFTRLPPELRLRVWTLFCPDLLGAPRVLDFNIHDSLSPTRTSPCKVIGAGMCLEEQTRALRRVLATNQQSRAIAKNRFPDELRLESDDGDIFTLCVNLEFDIAMLDRVPDYAHTELVFGLSTTTTVNLNGFSQSILKLALPLHDGSLFEQDADVTSWLRKFRSLQHIFLYTDENNFGGRRFKDDAVRWCASTHARQYRMETFEIEPGYGENYTKLACWPDSEESPFFTKAHVPKWHTKYLSRTQEDAFEDAGVKLHPMVIFQTEFGLERFNEFVATDYLPLKVYDANEEGSEADSYEEDPDEDFELNGVNGVDTYESDGIDDDEPEVFYESGDEHLDDGDSDDENGYDSGTVANRFSSPELSEDGGGPSVRGRKRRVIADSDDEDDDVPSNRPAKRKRVQIIEDSDEEDGLAESVEPQVISSDEDEDPTKRRRVELVDIDEESEDDSDEEDGQPQSVSLADRLQIRSRRVLSEEEDSEDEEEEEDEEDDDEEEDEDQDGLIDNMAAESDEDEEDAEEDE